MNLILSIYFSAPALARQAALKKTKVKSDLLPDISMLLIVEKGGICHSIYRHAKDDNNYMKHFHKNKKIVIYSILGCKLGNAAKAFSK